MKKTQKFTMVELLAVIAIIGILVGLLLPAVISGKEKALATKARTDVASIAAAIGQFEATYGYLPYTGTSPNSDGDTTDGTITYSTLIDILTGNNATMNPRNITFLSTDGTTLTDPWEQNYNVRLDYDYDGEIYVDGDGNADVIGKPAVWSNGPNGTPEDGDGDDITNWD
jgi:prepilin-type N-terminal cleavage/methylation domain-containing protein